MKIQAGKSYITFDGRSTGILKVNDGAAITFPYYSPELKVEYSETGRANIGRANNECGSWNILEPEYSPQMIVEAIETPNSEIQKLREENQAMKVCIRQNVKFLLELQKMFKSVEHKLPRELREYLNQ